MLRLYWGILFELEVFFVDFFGENYCGYAEKYVSLRVECLSLTVDGRKSIVDGCLVDCVCKSN